MHVEKSVIILGVLLVSPTSGRESLCAENSKHSPIPNTVHQLNDTVNIDSAPCNSMIPASQQHHQPANSVFNDLVEYVNPARFAVLYNIV